MKMTKTYHITYLHSVKLYCTGYISPHLARDIALHFPSQLTVIHASGIYLDASVPPNDVGTEP